mmetsp:Transcript_23011/g.26263  ORF Transcript_23011/g.26263 Transcript_23011/m.26263 type:complete len:297 (-) Transcript_23011:58-948(-)
MIAFVYQATVISRGAVGKSFGSPVVRCIIPYLHRHFSANESNNRLWGIKVNPESIGNSILPGGEYCLKHDPRTHADRRVRVEHNYGYFWMVSDLAKTKNKPIVSNKTIIPETEAESFPTLINCQEMKNDEDIVLPDYFLRDNRANDPSAQCTLVAISYKDHGQKLLKSWTEPFEQFYGSSQNRAKVMSLFITEGDFTAFLLASMQKRTIRSKTDPKLLSRTLVRFGSSGLLEFNDALRMHNMLTGYVYLLDGLGRVRFAGSGEASEKEVQNLIKFAKTITPKLCEEKISDNRNDTK